MIAFFIIILMIKLLDKLVNKATVVFERHFVIIVDGDSDLAFGLDQLLLVVELFQVRVLQDLEHGEALLWVEL
jgi:hypothetical protein